MFESALDAAAFITLTSLLLVAVGFDLTRRIIPNWVCACILCSGFVFQAVMFGVQGQIAAATGVLLALVIFVPMYAAQWMGAGDAKLMAAVGAFLGPVGLLNAVIFTLVAGGCMAFVHIVGRYSAYAVPRLIGFFAPRIGTSKIFFPYAAAIAAGSVCAQFIAIVEF